MLLITLMLESSSRALPPCIFRKGPHGSKYSVGYINFLFGEGGELGGAVGCFSRLETPCRVPANIIWDIYLEKGGDRNTNVGGNMEWWQQEILGGALIWKTASCTSGRTGHKKSR